MRTSSNSATFLWRSCGEPSAAWFLVSMPLVLLALEGVPNLGSAMVRLLAVLLVAGLIWARGRGPGGIWSERIFLAIWGATWAAALGILVAAGRWPASALGLAGLFVTLVVGAGWLGWACQARQELRRALAERPSPGAAEETRRPAATLAAVWLLAALLFALALSSRTAHWGDAFALTAALGGFTTFQRGSLGQPGAG